MCLLKVLFEGRSLICVHLCLRASVESRCSFICACAYERVKAVPIFENTSKIFRFHEGRAASSTLGVAGPPP